MLLGVVAILLLAVPAFAAGSNLPALTGRVVDNAGLFTPDQATEMTQALADFETATTDQIVVATVDSTDGQDIAEYGTDLFNSWKLGQTGKDNGALLLIAVNDRKAWITTGYGIEDRLTDARCGDIYRGYIKPFFQQGQYFEGIKSALAQMMAYAAPDYQTTFGTVAAPPTQTGSRGDGTPPLAVIILFIIFAILGSIGSRGRSRRYWGRRGFSTGGGFGGGGFGGGGGGFSGGGGSSGGGGAGGGW